MITRELANAAAPKLLDQRFEGVSTPSGLFASDVWCSAMGRNADDQTRKSSSAAVEPVCGKLRALFDCTKEPMPDGLASLADRLDQAFARGDLSGSNTKGPAR